MKDRAVNLEELKKLAAECIGSAAGEIDLIPSSTGKYNSTYFVEGVERPLVLRVAPEDRRELNLFYEHRMMRQEPNLHALIREHALAVPVPAIIHHDFSHERISRDFLIMEKMPGTPVSESFSLTRSSWSRTLGQLGESLRQVHAITETSYGYLGGHAPMKPQANWVDAFVLMWGKLLDDIESCGGYSPQESSALKKLLDSNLEHFEERRKVEASLLHMDIWAQNILVDGSGNLSGLIDWDRGLWGDPEIEFAVMDYCGTSEPAFWEAYGKRRDSSQSEKIRHAFYMLYEVQKYIFIRRVRGNNPTLADDYKSQSLRLASQLGLKL